MKIAIVVSTFPVVSETFILNQIKYLIDEGNEVSILSVKKGSSDVMHNLINNYDLLSKCIYWIEPENNFFKRIKQVYHLFKNSDYLNKTALFKLFLSPKQYKIIFNLYAFFKYQWILFNEFDIVHIHWAYNAFYFVDSKKAKMHKIPLVVSFHGNDIKPTQTEINKKRYKDFISNIDQITVNTKYTEQLLENVLDKSCPVSVIPVGLDTNYFRKKPTSISFPHRPFTIIFVGRIIKWKGPDLALETLNLLVKKYNYSNIKLIYIGTGDLLETLRQNVILWNLEDYVEFKGAQTQEVIIECMSDSDVLLSPGITEPGTLRAENQGLVIQEAQSMELPVIVSDSGGMKYGLIENETGFVVPEGDIEAFAEKLVFLLENSAIKNEMGKKARDFVVKNYDNNIVGNKFSEVYKNLLS